MKAEDSLDLAEGYIWQAILEMEKAAGLGADKESCAAIVRELELITDKILTTYVI